MYAVMLIYRLHDITVIWIYFTINDGNQRKVDCKLSSVKISRTGISNLIKHIKHKAQYKEFITSCTVPQATMKQMLARFKKCLQTRLGDGK